MRLKDGCLATLVTSRSKTSKVTFSYFFAYRIVCLLLSSALSLLVPVENLIGEEGQGFKIIMTNFNGERMGMAISSIRYARMCLEESVTYALKRNTFGRKLWSSPIIRAKVAEMAKRIESSWSWAEVSNFFFFIF